MFDWDEDYDALVEGGRTLDRSHIEDAVVISETPVQKAAKPDLAQRVRGILGRSAMALAVAVGLGAAGSVALTMPRGHHPIQTLSAMVAMPMELLGLGDTAMPEGLQAYDQWQYDNFRRGIRRFSDDDLLGYVSATERDIQRSVDLEAPVAATTRDALFLAQREAQRRGLAAPVASLGALLSRS